MNRRRNAPSRTPASVFFALLLAAVIVAGGGVLHAFFKNRQIQISREIDALDRRVEHYQLEIRTAEMRKDQLLNRFVIRTQLEDIGSDLRSIPLGLIEEVDPAPAMRQSVASAVP